MEGGALVPESVTVNVRNRNHSITAEVEVDAAAGGLRRIIEERVAVTHEVREGVDKARGTTDGGPGFAVEAVGEAGDFRRPWYAVGLADTLVDAYQKALDTDPVAAFGGIVAVNRELDRATAEKIAAAIEDDDDLLNPTGAERLAKLASRGPGPVLDTVLGRVFGR